MSLTRGEKMTLATTFGVAVFTIIAHIFIREWYQPDLRYEEGSYYRSGTAAVTSLKLHNYGHDDAAEISLSAHFPDSLTDLSAGDEGTRLQVTAGG